MSYFYSRLCRKVAMVSNSNWRGRGLLIWAEGLWKIDELLLAQLYSETLHTAPTLSQLHKWTGNWEDHQTHAEGHTRPPATENKHNPSIFLMMGTFHAKVTTSVSVGLVVENSHSKPPPKTLCNIPFSCSYHIPIKAYLALQMST